MPNVFVIKIEDDHNDWYYDINRDYHCIKTKRDIPVYGSDDQSSCMLWLFENVPPYELHNYRIVTNSSFYDEPSRKGATETTDNANRVLNFKIKPDGKGNYYIEYDDIVYESKKEKLTVYIQEYNKEKDPIITGCISIPENEFKMLLNRDTKTFMKIEVAIMRKVRSVSDKTITSDYFSLSNLAKLITNNELKDGRLCV